MKTHKTDQPTQKLFVFFVAKTPEQSPRRNRLVEPTLHCSVGSASQSKGRKSRAAKFLSTLVSRRSPSAEADGRLNAQPRPAISIPSRGPESTDFLPNTKIPVIDRVRFGLTNCWAYKEEYMEIIISIFAILVSLTALLHSVNTRKSVERLSTEEKRTHCLTDLYGLHSRYYILTQNLIDVQTAMAQHRKEHGLVKEALDQAYREIKEIAVVQELVFDQKVSAVEIEKLRPRIEGMKLRQQELQEDYESVKEFKIKRGLF